jgi:hypothetical protein
MNQPTIEDINMFRGSRIRFMGESVLEHLSNEEWKVNADFPNYEISSHGRIRRLKDSVKLKPYTVNGYNKVKLVNKYGARRAVRIHRLQMLTFEPIENAFLFDVDHIDFDPKNNVLTNLRWLKAKKNRVRKQG